MGDLISPPAGLPHQFGSTRPGQTDAQDEAEQQGDGQEQQGEPFTSGESPSHRGGAARRSEVCRPCRAGSSRGTVPHGEARGAEPCPEGRIASLGRRICRSLAGTSRLGAPDVVSTAGRGINQDGISLLQPLKGEGSLGQGQWGGVRVVQLAQRAKGGAQLLRCGGLGKSQQCVVVGFGGPGIRR